MLEPETIRFSGEVLAVKGRIRPIRSFDQVSHQYQGYTVVLRDDEAPEIARRIAIGPGAHAKHQFRIGDRICGNAHRVPDPHTEWAEFYLVSGLRLRHRGPEAQQRPPDPGGGITVP